MDLCEFEADLVYSACLSSQNTNGTHMGHSHEYTLRDKCEGACSCVQSAHRPAHRIPEKV